MSKVMLAVVVAGFSVAALSAIHAQSSHDPEPVAPGGKVAPAPALSPLAVHPVAALTFDDLPAAGSLPPGENRTRIATSLAAELQAYHLQGTYGFVNANKLENDPDAQQALHVWVDAGMNIGSHTWSHISLTSNSAEAFEKDIAQNEEALAKYSSGRDWHWFRYPFLWEGDTLDKRRAVRSYLREHGYRVAQVSLDFEDYAWKRLRSLLREAGHRCHRRVETELPRNSHGVHPPGSRRTADRVRA